MLDLFIVIFCLAINAIFSAYEMAFVTISKEEVEELNDEGSHISQSLARFKGKPERTLSVIQIGITLVGAIAAAVGGTGAVETLEPYLVQQFVISKTLAEVIAVAVVIIPLTYFSVVFGELVPKTIAMRYPKEVLNLGTKLISFIDRVLSPIVTFLEISTDFFLRILKLRREEDDEDISETIEVGHLPVYHRKFVQNLVSLKGKKISKTMIPWEKVSFLKFSDTDDEAKQKIKETHHSRFPVIDGDVLVGILHVKEWNETINNFLVPWQSILGPILKISVDDKILEVFIRMQNENHHLAVVVDESEQFVGIITMVNILEQIVGNIKDDLERSRTTKMLSHRGKITFSK
ncbi:MAG TPA: hemolysin family protein [Bacteriovoracaceae bacterium]|nr:hemolysin family protein [Bacteriovoracaceae bacterium]